MVPWKEKWTTQDLCLLFNFAYKICTLPNFGRLFQILQPNYKKIKKKKNTKKRLVEQKK